MLRDSVYKRSIKPVLLVLGLAVLSMLGYFNLRYLGNNSGFTWLVELLGLVYFLSIAFGTLYVFARSTIGGALMRERVLASFVVPFFWMTKEVIRITESHPLIECLYWYLNPLNIWLLTLIILEMGIATLIARRVMKNRGDDIRVLTVGPVATIIGSLIFVVSVYAWGKGENVYVIFLSGYRMLFGSGV